MLSPRPRATRPGSPLACAASRPPRATAGAPFGRGRGPYERENGRWWAAPRLSSADARTASTSSAGRSRDGIFAAGAAGIPAARRSSGSAGPELSAGSSARAGESSGESAPDGSSRGGW